MNRRLPVDGASDQKVVESIAVVVSSPGNGTSALITRIVPHEDGPCVDMSQEPTRGEL